MNKKYLRAAGVILCFTAVGALFEEAVRSSLRLRQVAIQHDAPYEERIKLLRDADGPFYDGYHEETPPERLQRARDWNVNLNYNDYPHA